MAAFRLLRPTEQRELPRAEPSVQAMAFHPAGHQGPVLLKTNDGLRLFICLF